MDLQIVNPDPKYSTVTLIPPTTLEIGRASCRERV